MRLLLIHCATIVSAVVAAVILLATPAPASTATRSTADRTDDVRGPQVHAVYAIPSDGVDRRLDESGAIEASVSSFTRWLAGETGGPTLRLDTVGGALDVTFVQLQQTDAAIAARGAFVRDAIETEMRSRGLIAPDKLYAVYYDGTSTFACGGGAWPPALPGQVGAMYLRGAVPGYQPCSANPLAAPGAPPGYMDIAMLHELLHTRGYVATCATHHTRAGHTSDNPNDLMWAGDAPWQLPPRLDIGRDDYYGHGRTDCPDLARDPFLTSNPPPPPEPPTPPVVAAKPLRLGPARAGRQLTAILPVTVDGSPAPTGTAACRATGGGRTLPLARKSFSNGAARCTWKLARTLRGKRVTVTVTATASGTTFRRSTRARVT